MTNSEDDAEKRRKLLRRLKWGALGAVLIAVAVGVVVLVVGEADDESEAVACTYDPDKRTDGEKLDKSVKLVPDVPGEVVNFGGSEGHEYVDVVLNATPALPSELRPSDLRLEVLKRFSRGSTTLRREDAPKPTFTDPEISANRDRVTFTICLGGDDLAAGTYTGSVLVEGPTGLSPTSINITENAKNSTLAVFGGIGAIIAAFIFLVLRGAASRQITERETHAEELEETVRATKADRPDAARQADRPDAARQAEAARQFLEQKPPPPKRHVLTYLGEVFRDLNWWVTTLVALGLAVGTIVAIYQANPAWGADTWSSVVALVGPVFSAVGVQSVVTSLGRSVGQDKQKESAK